MKKTIYLSLFILLGILISSIAHAIIEMFAIKLLLYDFSKFGLGFTWYDWIWIHNVLAVLFFLSGVTLGGWQGIVWWKKIYGTR